MTRANHQVSWAMQYYSILLLYLFYSIFPFRKDISKDALVFSNCVSYISHISGVAIRHNKSIHDVSPGLDKGIKLWTSVSPETATGHAMSWSLLSLWIVHWMRSKDLLIINRTNIVLEKVRIVIINEAVIHQMSCVYVEVPSGIRVK